MKKPQDNDTFLTQLIRLEADECSPEEITALNQELLVDPHKRRALIDHYEQGQLIRNMSRQNQVEGSSLLLTTASSNQREWYRSPAVIIIGLSAAAIILLFLGISKLNQAPQQQDSPTAAAAPLDKNKPNDEPHIAYTKNAVWADGNKPSTDHPITRGQWRLKSGIVIVEFADGTQATIKGPAKFDITSSNVIKLDMGDLVASNDRGKILTVISKGKKITSEGKSFGVRSQKNKAAQICAFQGNVRLFSGTQAPVTLMAGNSASALNSPAYGRMTSSDRLSFQDALMADIGIKSMQGSTLLFPSDIKFGLMEKEADGTAFLIPERYLDRGKTLEVSQVGSGTLNGLKVTTNTARWTTLGECRSYLLHASPSTRLKHLGAHSFEGQITFYSPIKAVITSASLLDATEKELADPPRTRLGSGRGLEHTHTWEKDAHGKYVSDVIKVSEDRKTLHFNLKVGHGLDQIRIITAVR